MVSARSITRHAGRRSGWRGLAAALLLLATSCGKAPDGAPPRTEEPSSPVREAAVTMRGKPLSLEGTPQRVGDVAPDFAAVADDLSEFRLSSLAGKVVLLVSVPSLDTKVCDTETRTFNEKLGALGPDVAGVVVSMDLPFAQKRWCAAAGIENVRTVSDYREAAFGLAYGELIPELRLLARAVFVVDRTGRIAYLEQVPDLSHEPDYAAALAAVKAALDAPPPGR